MSFIIVVNGTHLVCPGGLRPVGEVITCPVFIWKTLGAATRWAKKKGHQPGWDQVEVLSIKIEADPTPRWSEKYWSKQQVK